MATYETIEQYLADVDDGVRERLVSVLDAVQQAVPDATPAIRYGMPTLRWQDHNLIHVSAWKHHIGVYPVPEGDAEYERAVAPYSFERGTARFRHVDPLPLELVRRMAELRRDALAAARP